MSDTLGSIKSLTLTVEYYHDLMREAQQQRVDWILKAHEEGVSNKDIGEAAGLGEAHVAATVRWWTTHQ